MTGVPTFALSGGFLGITRRDTDPALAVAGIPFDIATTNRPGARFGPDAIRRASRMLVDGDHPVARRDLAAGLSDMGDFEIALRSEEHTSELQSLMRISYAVFCLKKKKQKNIQNE